MADDLSRSEEGYEFFPESLGAPPLSSSSSSGGRSVADRGRTISDPFVLTSVNSFTGHGAARRGSTGNDASGRTNGSNDAPVPVRVKFILGDRNTGSGEMRGVLVTRPLNWLDLCTKAKMTFRQLQDKPLPPMFHVRESGTSYLIRNQDDVAAIEAGLAPDTRSVRIQIALDQTSPYDALPRTAGQARTEQASPRTYGRQVLASADIDSKPPLAKALSEPSQTLSSFEPTSDFHEYNSLQLPPMLVEERFMHSMDLSHQPRGELADGMHSFQRTPLPFQEDEPPPGSIAFSSAGFMRQESSGPSVFEGGGEFIPETDDSAEHSSAASKKIFAIHPAQEHWPEDGGSIGGGGGGDNADNVSVGSDRHVPHSASPRLVRPLQPPVAQPPPDLRSSPKADVAVSPLTHSATGVNSLTSNTSSNSATSGERDRDSVHSLKMSGDHQSSSDTGMPARWKRGRQLGTGAFGTVYLCHDIDTGRELAVKQVEVGNLGSEMRKEVVSLQAEIELLKKLQHERIVAYVGIHNSGGTLSIMMEYMAGGSIHGYLRENGALTEKLARKYTQQVLEGLNYLHSQRIIHRDVKGANILRDLHGNVKLADFGASRRLQTIKSMSCLKSVHGTPYWMSPEVLSGNGYNEKADIWSLGCTVIEMISGKPPLGDLEPMAALFRIGTCQEGPEIPEDVSVACTRFLDYTFQRQPDRRASAAQLLRTEFILSKSGQV